jgi:precorrin-2 dehydrogenase/sirohydrochlorin ferrochelatase
MTVPLALDLGVLPAALAGNGPPLLKRLALLDGEQAPNLHIYSSDPAAAEAAGGRLVPRLPNEAEIAACRVLFLAGLPTVQSAELAAIARKHRVLVNVEDTSPLCDFHVPAILRRGELAISISTGGSSPTLSRRLRTYLEGLFPEEWADRVARIARLRLELRGNGTSNAEIARVTEAVIDSEAWLPKH